MVGNGKLQEKHEGYRSETIQQGLNLLCFYMFLKLFSFVFNFLNLFFSNNF